MTKNINYREFLAGGLFLFVEEEHIQKALENIDRTTKRKLREEAKALLVMLYYTGCRPSEALLAKSNQIENDNGLIKIRLVTLKRGRARTIWLSPKKFPMVKILWQWHLKKYHEEYLFFHFMGRYKHKKIWKKKDGTSTEKEYIEISPRLPYYFERWFEGIITHGINPYYLRHNKFSKLAERDKITDRGLMQMKGSTTYASIAPYIHQSAEFGKKMATKGG